MIRTRFAPSPTGYLHLGGARTALFAWAWARQHGGEFLLRVEDTDAARSGEEYSRAIIAAMQWLGLTYDGAARFQSANINRHRKLAAQLKESGAVFEEGGALRLKTPDAGEVFFEDRVCGRLAVENKELESPVILRADGTPTYIFASAADDMEDG
ncbi:MAG: glutamate--tRNA ligase, partial [Betaproteobacteria bacterium]|nr:glutamate--tRNA ligase [Betaproteobacteria bacterium]